MKSRSVLLGVIVSLGIQLPLLAQEEASAEAKLYQGRTASLYREGNGNPAPVAVSAVPTLQDSLFRNKKKHNRKVAPVSVEASSSLQDTLFKSKKKRDRKVMLASVEANSGPTLQDILLKSKKKRNRKIC